jgi:hypothetical protein
MDIYKFAGVEEFLVMRGIDVMTGCDVQQTRVRRRAESKSLVRFWARGHDESKPAERDNWAAVSLRTTRMSPPHFVQCQRAGLAGGVAGGI